MDIILIDTSVWINFFKAKETEASLYLKNNTSNIVIATCPIIVQEVLQGVVQDREFKVINAYFKTFTRLVGEQYSMAYEAAELYRNLRKKGVTIRKPNDCLIATYAIKNNIVLLNDDRDFRLIAEHSSLRTMNFN
jgi:predicted nucleic acid-binding protein